MDAYYGFKEHGLTTYTGPIFYVDGDLKFVFGHWYDEDIETKELVEADYEKYRKGCDRYELVYSNSLCGRGYDVTWLKRGE